jgi:DNA-binding PadR family transcriptional regulator
MARQPTLSSFELMVMLAIIRIGNDAYGVSISDEIEETTDSEVLLGSVYDALARLEEKGLIASTLGESTAERGGRAKRHFRPTSKGHRFFRPAELNGNAANSKARCFVKLRATVGPTIIGKESSSCVLTRLNKFSY